MGINIALCETEAEKAPCRSLKMEVRRARTDAAGFDDYMIYEEKVSLDDARNVFPDFEGFLKRNRINAETDAVYMDKVKKDEDREALSKYVKKTATGWIDLTRMDAATKEKALKAAGPDDRTTPAIEKADGVDYVHAKETVMRLVGRPKEEVEKKV